MNINRLREIAKQRKKSIRDLAKIAEMSETGFHQALSNNSLKVDALEKMAIGLNIPVSAFFESMGEKISNNSVHQSGTGYKISQVQSGINNKQSIGKVETEPENYDECVKMLRIKELEIQSKDKEIFYLKELLQAKDQLISSLSGK